MIKDSPVPRLLLALNVAKRNERVWYKMQSHELQHNRKKIVC